MTNEERGIYEEDVNTLFVEVNKVGIRKATEILRTVRVLDPIVPKPGSGPELEALSR